MAIPYTCLKPSFFNYHTLGNPIDIEFQVSEPLDYPIRLYIP